MSFENMQAPEDQRDVHDADVSTAESRHVEPDHEVAAQAARRQARQDPLQG